MSIVSLATIKNWFKTGLKPTQAQFWDVWDSFRHKSETVPYADIEGLDVVLLAQDVKINAIALPDDVLIEGDIIIASGNATIPAEDFVWRLLQVEYTNALLFTDVLPTATIGYIRTDIFVGTNLGTIYRVTGPEGIGVAIKPDAPAGTIELGSVDIEGLTVSTPIIVRPRVTVFSVNGMRGDVEIGILDIPELQETLDSKLDAADYNTHFKGVHLTEAALIAAYPTANAGDSAQVNQVGATDVVNYSWDAEENIWVNNGTGGSGAVNTDALPEGSTNLYWTVSRFLANLTYANVIAALGFTPSTAPNDAQKNSNITKAEIEAKLTGEITTHTHPSVGGGGDMVLASDQTVSGLKTFLSGMFGLRNVANTFTSFFANANTASRTYTLPDASGTLALLASPTFSGTVGMPSTLMSGTSAIYWGDSEHKIQYLGGNVMEIKEYGTLRLKAPTIELTGAVSFNGVANSISGGIMTANAQTGSYVINGIQHQGSGVGQVSALARFVTGFNGSGFYLSSDGNLRESGIATHASDNFNIICAIGKKIKFRRGTGNNYYGLPLTANESTEIGEFDANDNLRVKGFDLSQFGSFANDSAASSGGVAVGFAYINSSTGALHRRLT